MKSKKEQTNKNKVWRETTPYNILCVDEDPTMGMKLINRLFFRY